MAAQSLLAKLGMRMATLGTAASLALAAPLSEGDSSMAAHISVFRIGQYYDRTAGAEKQAFVTMGVEQFAVGADSIILRQQAGAPATPTDGMVWLTSAGMFCRSGGVTSGPFGAATGIGGTIAVDQVAVGSGVDTIAGSAALKWSAANGFSANRTVVATNEMFGLNAGNAAMSDGNHTLVGNSAGAVVTSGRSLTIVGSAAGANADNPYYGTFIGAGAGTGIISQDHNTAVGYHALFVSDAANDTAIGSEALANGSDGDNIAIGYQSGIDVDTGYANIMIGNGASVDNGPLSGNVIVGINATSSYSNCIVLGYSATSEAANQFIVGSQTVYYNDIYFGSGYYHATGVPQNISINASKGQGTNSNGGDLNLKAGTSTGLGLGGALRLYTSNVGLTGAAQNPLVNHWSLLRDGATAWTGITTATAPAVSAANNGNIFYDRTLQVFRYSANGGAYANLVSGGTIGGTLTATRVPFASGTSTLTDNAAMVFSTTRGLSVNRNTAGSFRSQMFGDGAGNTTLTGTDNTLVGYEVGDALTGGSRNTGMGANALGTQTNISDNTAFGYNALFASTAAQNTAVGSGAADGLTSGTNCVAVGYNALSSATTTSNNTAVGSGAMSNSTASNGTAVGKDALSQATGADNTAVGFSAASVLSGGTQNTAVGSGTLTLITNNSNATAVGYFALRVNTAADNTAVGALCASTVTSATGVTAVGRGALNTGTTGVGNCTAIGLNALNACTVADNTAVGSGAADVLTTSLRVVVVGKDALGTGTTGVADSTAVGYLSLRLATADGNTAVGSQSGDSISTGTSNVLIGSGAGASVTTGLQNVMIGANAHGATATSNSLAIGTNATANHDNCILLGTGATSTATGQALIGSSDAPIFSMYVGKGVTATTPGNIVINGTGGSGADKVGASVTIAAGISTGAGIGGSVIIQTSPATGSSSTPNTLTTRLTVDQLGNVVCGSAAIATNATDGFFYMVSCAGTPTGVPTTFTGRAAYVYDTSANKIWVYNGSWRGVVVA